MCDCRDCIHTLDFTNQRKAIARTKSRKGGRFIKMNKRVLADKKTEQKEKKAKVEDKPCDLPDVLSSKDLFVGPHGDLVLPWKRGSEVIVPINREFPVDDHKHACFGGSISSTPINDEMWGTLMGSGPKTQHGAWPFTIKITNPPSRETMRLVHSGLPMSIERGDVVTFYSKESGGLDCYGVCESPASAVHSAQLVQALKPEIQKV